MSVLKLERHHEAGFIELCRQLGIRQEKLKMASKSSWPDRTLLYRGCAMFLELKRKGEKPEPLQQYTLDQLTKEGFDARWSDDLELTTLIVIGWKQHVDRNANPLHQLRT